LGGAPGLMVVGRADRSARAFVILFAFVFATMIAAGCAEQASRGNETEIEPPETALEQRESSRTPPAEAEVRRLDWRQFATVCPDEVVEVTGSERITYPVPCGSRLFYVKNDRSESLPEYRCMTGPSELHVTDARTGEDRLLAETTIPLGQLDVPCADGDWVVWLDWAEIGEHNGDWKLFALNMESGEQFCFAESGPGGDPQPTGWLLPIPKLHDGKVVWSAEVKERGYVHVYDLEAQTEEVITDTGHSYSPQIWGGRVVYLEWHPEDRTHDLMMYDLATGERRALVEGIKISYFSLCGDWVAYNHKTLSEDDYHQDTLYLLHLEKGDRRLIAPRTRKGFSHIPALGDGFLAYHNTAYSHFKVYAFANPEKSFIIRPREGVSIMHPHAHGGSLAWWGYWHDPAENRCDGAYLMEVDVEPPASD